MSLANTLLGLFGYSRSTQCSDRAASFEASAALSREVVGFVQRLRTEDLFKKPGVAETIDWANAMVELNRSSLEPGVVDDTLGVLLKYQDDIARIKGSEAARILSEVQAAA